MMINTIAEFCNRRETNIFKLANDAGVSPSTLYRLRANPTSLPGADVLDKIFNLYPDATPNDLIRHIPDGVEGDAS
ncbi:helix-turn-helix transcriptional regulator [Chroococcidiopsis sp. FACHB-1243]|uniref:helix-turn-helix domain-containing protein n=1 Tax=Chroococcidiopsis sp. [FACHB-1243] TaxID=2692781 RepID=UPI0017816301|nr:helix-turn-helix transcriptional regulator [Chroococcidiopsis sp. [FACHB-1243]]MBD2305836.1 helix-turn-helix transcriptional regulator [Chroococcidiopsis sp. [FACHB-1243]]